MIMKMMIKKMMRIIVMMIKKMMRMIVMIKMMIVMIRTMMKMMLKMKMVIKMIEMIKMKKKTKMMIKTIKMMMIAILMNLLSHGNLFLLVALPFVYFQGYTALHLAAMQGHHEIMSILEDVYGKLTMHKPNRATMRPNCV